MQHRLDSWVNRITAAEAQRRAAEERVGKLRKQLEEETNHKQTLESQAMQLKLRTDSLFAENKTLLDGAVPARSGGAIVLNVARNEENESALQKIPPALLTGQLQTSPSPDEITQLKARVAELENEVEDLIIMAKIGCILVVLYLYLTRF